MLNSTPEIHQRALALSHCGDSFALDLAHLRFDRHWIKEWLLLKAKMTTHPL
jgi:hypothetical protein